MKKLTTWNAGVAVLGLLVLSAAPASAQTSAIRADVPFAFTVADKLLPAGGYRFSLDPDQKVVRIAQEQGNRIWLARIIAGGEQRDRAGLDNGLLRFTRHGNQHFLTGVFQAGSLYGKSVMPSRIPRELGSVKTVRDVSATK